MTVGRQFEREALASFIDDRADHPCAALLEGESGIGKSTLWSGCVEMAAARGRVVLSCRPTGSDAKLSYVGLGDLLRDVPEGAFADLPAPQREALEVSLLRRPRGARRPDPRAVSVAALGILQVLSADGSPFVAVDDVPSLDAATARVLGFIVRRASGGVRFLLSRADVDGPPPLGVTDSLSPDRIRRIRLGPLGASDLAELVRQHIGVEMTLSEARRLAEVSGGNPFFALEIAQAVAAGDRGVTGQALPIPKSLREDLVRRHLGALPAASADLLLVAAASDRPTLGILGVTGGDARASRRLQLAVDAGLVQVLGTELRFTHPIYRSTIYAGASRDRRHAVHRRLAEIASDPEERARHLALSADGPDDDIADALEEAANIARDRGAPDAAAELLEHAIRLTPPAAVTAVRRRHLEAVEQRFVAGDLGHAVDHASEALRRSDSGLERAEARERIAAMDLARGALADARRSLEAAAAEAEADPRVSARVFSGLAEVALRGGDLTVAERHARAALHQANRSGEAALVLEAETTRSRVALLLGDSAGVLLSPLAIGRGEPGPRADPFELVLAEAEMIAGQHEHARRRLKTFLETASDRGDEPGRRAALALLTEVELRDGSWDRAGETAEDARSLAHNLGLADGLEVGLLAYLAAVRGQVEEANELAALGLRGAVDDRQALLWSLGALGALELSLGRPELALRHLGRVGGIATEMELGEPAALPFLPDEAEALLGAGELDAADRRITWLEQRGEALGRAWALAVAARCRGLLHAETGDLVSALASLEGAAERLDELPMPLDRGRSFLALGSARRRDRQKRAAREALERALGLFEALGAQVWADRARVELARVSGRKASLTELTESEARVVRLAAAGLTNREIARTLSMSVRTVEGHLSHVYAKLGLRSRTELAVFFDRSD